MLPIITLALAMSIAALIALLANFRFLMYPLIPALNPVVHAESFRLKGSTLFISDLHLKSNQSSDHANDLRNFIETNNVSNLVVDGDLFDSPKDAREILRTWSQTDAIKTLGLGNLPVNLFWVLGSPAHDPGGVQENRTVANGIGVLGRCAWIDCDGSRVLAYHGHDMSHIGALGHAWDRFVSELGLERLWKRLAKVDGSVWVVFGHTHTFLALTDEVALLTAERGRRPHWFVQPERVYFLLPKKMSQGLCGSLDRLQLFSRQTIGLRLGSSLIV
jgi:predicted phosphodiesterase